MNTIKTTRQKTILVIGTGGTIAGTGAQGETISYSAGQVKIEDILSEIPILKPLANIKSEELFSLDSCDMSFENLKRLAVYINEAAARDDIQGFVITHGTDTLEETAYFLNLTVKTDKPIVITGAMRPSTALSPDGPFNLYQAVALAASDEAGGKGVLIVFADTICGARDICKVNTFRVNAFGHQDLGCFGYMRDDIPYFYNNSLKKHTINTEFDINEIENFPRVEVLNFYVDSDIKLLEYFSKNTDGLILGGVGSGGCSAAWDEKIKELLNRGFPVVRSSRVGNGLVTYKEDQLNKKGVYANTLPPQKARILLMLALTKTRNLHKIQKMFNVY